MYSGEYDACDVTLSVYPHRASLKISRPDHGGNRTTISIVTVVYRPPNASADFFDHFENLINKSY
jgi:hypothetical protein